MTEPCWIGVDFILFAHDRIVAETGGRTGLREQSLLESAVARPQNTFLYEENDDVFYLAAVYAVSISSNHPFIDGNKRTAFVVAGLFLEKNGYSLISEHPNEQAQLFLDLAEGKITKEELARWYKDNSIQKEKTGELEPSIFLRHFKNATAENLPKPATIGKQNRNLADVQKGL